MKNKVYTYYNSLIILLSISFMSYAQTGWQEVTSLPNTANITSISVVDENTVWVCCEATSVFRTTDGGTTWQSRNGGIPATDLYGISATDIDHCWVGTGAGRIFRTTNGGLSWGLQANITGSFINGVHMFDNNNGVFSADPTGNGVPFQFRVTTDGGANWTLPAGTPIANNEYGVINGWDWTDQNHFWIGGANIITNATSSRIFYTTTGFNGTWNSATIPGTGNSQGLYFQAIGMTDTLNGIAGTNAGNLVKTVNGGISWTSIAPPSGVNTFAIININALKDGSNLIRALFNSTDFGYKIFTTTDLGTNWIEETIPNHILTNGVQHIRFLNASLGYAGGKNGVVIKYTGVLPVELTSFTADVSKGNVTLNWITASELNNHGFEIERRETKYERQEDWKVIGFVNGNGTTTETNSYFFADENVLTEKYFYRLKQIDFNGTFEYSNTIEVDLNIPAKFLLEQNYPNPFNPNTTISYSITQTADVLIKIYDILGKEITTLVDETKDAGKYNINFNASMLTSGIYYYSIKAGEFTQTKKMTLIK